MSEWKTIDWLESVRNNERKRIEYMIVTFVFGIAAIVFKFIPGVNEAPIVQNQNYLAIASYIFITTLTLQIVNHIYKRIESRTNPKIRFKDLPEDLQMILVAYNRCSGEITEPVPTVSIDGDKMFADLMKYKLLSSLAIIKPHMYCISLQGKQLLVDNVDDVREFETKHAKDLDTMIHVLKTGQLPQDVQNQMSQHMFKEPHK